MRYDIGCNFMLLCTLFQYQLVVPPKIEIAFSIAPFSSTCLIENQIENILYL